MRGGVLMLCGLAACRFGFDARTGDGGAGDDTSLTGDGPPADAIAIPPGAPAAMRELCMVTRTTVIRAGITADDNMANGVAAQIASGCGSSPAARSVSQDDPGILDPSTNRPLLAIDDLGVVGGGDTYQRVMQYLLVADSPIVISETASRLRMYDRTNNATLLDVQKSMYNNSHDVAVVMLTYEPIGSASVLSLFGKGTAGTLAAGYWFSTMLAPSITTNDKRWYIVDWLDGNNDQAPNAPDTYSIIAMGP